MCSLWRRLVRVAGSAGEGLCCEQCGTAIAADASVGVWVHDPGELEADSFEVDEDHAARLPEGTPHPAE
jgi:hypothetical protein